MWYSAKEMTSWEARSTAESARLASTAFDMDNKNTSAHRKNLHAALRVFLVYDS